MNNNKRTTEEQTFQQVFNSAKHLFGIAPEKKEPKLEPETPEVLLPEGTILAVHPMITNQDFAATMDNYRVYVAEYNEKVKEENKQINKHNAMVALNNEPENKQTTEMLKTLFYKHNMSLPNRDFNAKADEFCKTHGYIIEKRKIQTVKPSTELFFQNFLHIYSKQMHERTSTYIKNRLTARRPLQELDIRSDKVTALKRNGVKSVNTCNKTVRNHRQRLQEAGVLEGYVFRGTWFGVSCNINPTILVFTDVYGEKSTTTDNQSVSDCKGKVLPNLSEEFSTRSINKPKIKDNASQLSDKERAKPATSSHYENTTYKNTKSNLQNSPGGAPKKPETLSEKLRNRIISTNELAQKLARGDYNNYTPIDVRIFWREASSGTLTDFEFREMWFQDFFKMAAKIWRNSTPFVGSWQKAINEFMDRAMLTFNGHSLDKMTITKYTEEYRWCINNAFKWFNKTGVNPLFPSDYFDKTRDTKYEIGFEYQRKRYKKHLKSQEDTELQKRKRARNAELRKASNNDAMRCKKEIKRFLNNKITLPQLENYVKNNLPENFLDALPEMIIKAREIHFKKV